MKLEEETWTLIEGSRDHHEMSRIVKGKENKYSDEDFVVAYVITDHQNEEARVEDLKRARLITAAPKLLKALKRAWDEGRDDTPEMWDEIEEAINTAEGFA